MIDTDFGMVKIKLDEVIKQQNISKNKLSQRAEIQRSQINKWCKNEIQRIDISILARLCYVLECDISDLIEYTYPVPTNNSNTK